MRVRDVENGRSPHTGWATGTNLSFCRYARERAHWPRGRLGAIDNLGKGAAGQALQNANLMTGQPESAGLGGLPTFP